MRGVSLFLASCLALFGTSAAVRKPHPMILHSAYTPFGAGPSYKLNVSVIPTLAKQAKAQGVNTVFVCGSMSEFDTMTVDERKALLSAWVSAAKTEGLYTIVNVGTTVKEEAKELARFAKSQNADAIASMAPYYTKCSTPDVLLDWLMDIADEVEELPFFFYHIPGTTGTDVQMSLLLRMAEEAGFTQFTEKGGVKYVSSDLWDFLNVSSWVAEEEKRNATILWAPEPKLQAFAMQVPFAGAVLAEDFYAPTYLRMRAAYERGDTVAAIKEQLWKNTVDGIFGQYGGTAAKRASYLKSCGVHMGDSRPPGTAFNYSLYDDLIADLDAVGFWNQTLP